MGIVDAVDLSDTWVGGFFEDVNSEDENLTECEGEDKWGDVISGGFGGGVNENKKDIWGDEGWENDTCKVGL